MIFDWRDYQNLAQWLYDNPMIPNCSTETTYRAVISRVYYAAFQCVLTFAKEEDNFLPRGSGDDHGRLLKHFAASGKGPRRRIYLSLDRIRDNRRQADYDSALMSDPQGLAHAALIDAKHIFNALEQLKN